MPQADGSLKEGLEDNYRLGVSIHTGFGQGVQLSESVQRAAHRRGLHTQKFSPVWSLLSLLLSKEATSHKKGLKHQSLNKGHTKCISYTEDLSKRGKNQKVKGKDEINMAFYNLRIKSFKDFSWNHENLVSFLASTGISSGLCFVSLPDNSKHSVGGKHQTETKWHKVI